jgi:hypothetical protein
MENDDAQAEPLNELQSREPSVEDLVELCKQLDPGDVNHYTVVRIADEIVIDLMKSACGIEYAEALKEVVMIEVEGVPIPFASPRLLLKMKQNTHREKDALDLVFLKRIIAGSRG